MPEKFCKHKKDWFLNRVNKTLIRARTMLTPRSVIIPTVELKVLSEKHAEAIYLNHLDNKINFYEKPTA